ncbi:MAG: hypothetical protein ACFCVK_14010 [Acidimicrobiales bacterium]
MGPTTDDLRGEMRAWLGDNWDPNLTVRHWWARLAAAGWQFPTWPEGLGGRGLHGTDARAVTSELVDAGALGPPFSLGQVMGGPVVIGERGLGLPKDVQVDRDLPFREVPHSR